MGTHCRIRTSRNQEISKKRQHELKLLIKRSGMSEVDTVADAAFMDSSHLLHCHCGSNARLTIIAAVDKGWIVGTRHRTIMTTLCPKCRAVGMRRIAYNEKNPPS